MPGETVMATKATETVKPLLTPEFIENLSKMATHGLDAVNALRALGAPTADTLINSLQELKDATSEFMETSVGQALQDAQAARKERDEAYEKLEGWADQAEEMAEGIRADLPEGIRRSRRSRY